MQLIFITVTVSGLSDSPGDFQSGLDWFMQYRRASWKFRLFGFLCLSPGHSSSFGHTLGISFSALWSFPNPEPRHSKKKIFLGQTVHVEVMGSQSQQCDCFFVSICLSIYLSIYLYHLSQIMCYRQGCVCVCVCVCARVSACVCALIVNICWHHCLAL